LYMDRGTTTTLVRGVGWASSIYGDPLPSLPPPTASREAGAEEAHGNNEVETGR
jgi:hypothetical protein